MKKVFNKAVTSMALDAIDKLNGKDAAFANESSVYGNGLSL